MLYQLALLSPPYSTLTYAAPACLSSSPAESELWKPGLRVAVPLGNGAARVAVLLEKTTHAPSGVAVRDMIWPLEQIPLVDEEYLDMVRQLAARQLCSPGRILGHILPRDLRSLSRIRVRQFRPDGRPILHSLRAVGAMEPAGLAALARAFAEGQADMVQTAEEAAEICRLACEPPWPVRPNALRQRQLLDWFLEQGSAPRRRVLDALPGCAASLDSLIRAGLVAVEAGTEDDSAQETLLPPSPPPFALNPEQQAILDSFVQTLDTLCSQGNQNGEYASDSASTEARLLYGVTGSGKTAVYLELARACLERGKSALLLAPEIALALKLHRDAARRFPDLPLFLYHGCQSPARRSRIFRELAERAHKGHPCLVVGTRSALFLPLPQLGAVVLDEEHDASFKQDEGLPYQAKEVAWQRVSRHHALLVLGSATPDIKTFYAASRGAFPLLRLPHRAGGGTLPAVELVDIRESGTGSVLAEASVDALRETASRGEQAVVLLNRRGYAPLMYCLDCGRTARCPHCDIGLTYHKHREQLVCHYCGHTRPFPLPCEFCRGLHFLPMGQGTERLEEELAGLLPSGILRLDRDSTRRPGRMEEILTRFARQEAQILVGTQMLSKGHHFPQVTLAVIADADVGLNLPDYRAAERTFQLLLQAAGRSGRGEKPGRVLIQTRSTNHYCWDFVCRNDYEGFYAQEIALREKRRYPPFVKLALIRLSFPVEWQEGPALVRDFGAVLRSTGKECGITVLGPAPAPLSRLQGRLRFQFLIKAADWRAVRLVYSRAFSTLPGRQTPWRVSLDMDPVNML